MAGLLICLWHYLLNPEAEILPKEVLTLIQRALVLLGSTYEMNIKFYNYIFQINERINELFFKNFLNK